MHRDEFDSALRDLANNRAADLFVMPTEMRGMNVILYTRSGCHLCDSALQTLVDHGLQPHKVDIDANETLCERFSACVPVVEIDGKIRFRGQVDPRLLKRLLRNCKGQQP